MSKQRRRANWPAAAVGLAATLATIVAYALGGLDWLEYKTLDLRFLYTNSIPQQSNLVCIDIDDAALQKIGRWPWPRDVQAGIVSVLADVGMRSLLIDVTLGEPEPLRTIVPRQADIAFNPLELATGRSGTMTLALPDLELRAAIEDVGSVYLATDYGADKSWQNFVQSDEFAQLLVSSDNGRPQPGQPSSSNAQRVARQGEPAWAPSVWAQLVRTLEDDPTLDDTAVAKRIGPSLDAISPVLSACRAVALQRRIRAWLTEEPNRWNEPPPRQFEQLEELLMPQSGRYLEDLAVALRYVLGDAATTATPFASLERVAAAAPRVAAISPVYFGHARVAKRCGFVVFEPDGDGVLRRTRLLVQHNGRVLPQLAFAVACDALGLGPDDIRAEPERLILHISGRSLTIQLDARGRALIPWLAQRDWRLQFGEHVPIDALWQVFDRRQSILRNDALILDRLDALLQQGQLAEHQQYREDLATRLKLDQQWRLARYRGDRRAATEDARLIAACDRLVESGEPPLRTAAQHEIEHSQTLPAQRNPSPPAPNLAVFDDIHRALLANADYRAEIEHALAWLRPRIQGRLGLLGYTATALADMTPIPTNSRAPGVIAHANLINGLLAGRTVASAPAWLNGLLTLVFGLLASAVTLWRGPRGAAAAVALLALTFLILAGGLAFYRWSCWIALTPVLGAMLVSYAAIMLFRYIFLERESRQIATALSQYTSATLARKMAEDPVLCRRAETREVTAVFTDLEGFTSISERIGAERTQHLLNVTLGRLSDVMLRHEGMINKFIGDGIFAFWNPVIYPQPDHAWRACETAIDLQVALRDLIAAEGRAGGDAVFSELRLRVGVATGRAVVGPCGSEQKYDYTCIGDSVNVASRLESANKFYGTQTLISGATYAAVSDAVVVRSLGGVRVKGKTQAVPIYELLGRPGEVDAERLVHGQHFAAAVAAFQERRWREALTGFEGCLQARADDLAARQYLAAIRRFMVAPPDDDWVAALELTEK